jgi:hypothetical protein
MGTLIFDSETIDRETIERKEKLPTRETISPLF